MAAAKEEDAKVQQILRDARKRLPAALVTKTSLHESAALMAEFRKSSEEALLQRIESKALLAMGELIECLACNRNKGGRIQNEHDEADCHCVEQATMRPIIFLDIDDVLAISREYTSEHVMTALKSRDRDDWRELWAGLVFAEARANLAALHKEFWPQYVISSSWSNYLTREQMQIVFRRNELDFVAGNMHKRWTTPKGKGPSRTGEIESWISRHGQRRQPMLVLDDHDSGVGLHESSLDQQGLLVLCDPWIGFNADKLVVAQRLLRAQMAPRAPLMMRILRPISEAEMEAVVRSRTSPGSHEQLTLADAGLEDEVREIQAKAGSRLPGTCSESADDDN